MARSEWVLVFAGPLSQASREEAQKSDVLRAVRRAPSSAVASRDVPRAPRRRQARRHLGGEIVIAEAGSGEHEVERLAPRLRSLRSRLRPSGSSSQGFRCRRRRGTARLPPTISKPVRRRAAERRTENLDAGGKEHVDVSSDHRLGGVTRIEVDPADPDQDELTCTRSVARASSSGLAAANTHRAPHLAMLVGRPSRFQDPRLIGARLFMRLSLEPARDAKEVGVHDPEI